MPTQEDKTRVLDRAQGALLGQAIGDALGTTVEFQGATSIARRFPNGLRDLIGGGPFHLLPGQITDDTELALALARTLVDYGEFVDDAVAAAYWLWYQSGPFDVGNTTAQAFGTPLDYGPGIAERMWAAASRTSQANGSLMCQSPLGIFGWRLEAHELADLACRDSALSHPHPACQESCVAFTFAIAMAIKTGASPREIYDATLTFMQTRSRAGTSGVLPALIDAEKSPPADFYDQMGWVLKALQNAFYRLLHAENLEEGIVQTVQCGGDTDTNACIAGALLGAVYGQSTIPPRWIHTLLACRTSRPETHQCADLPQLAEKLCAVNPTRIESTD